MRLSHDLHLAYCTNIHRGETWPETLANLERHTLAVRDQVCPDAPFAIGLRLGDEASRELSDPERLTEFQRWLDRHHAYVFTINGFPYGTFHGEPVRERVYQPDWTTAERVEYTMRLFRILAQLLPPGVAGSVSTVPGSFKEFITTQAQEQAMVHNLWRCVEEISRLSEASQRDLHLGLEPEPLCYLETTAEVVRFFDQLRAHRPQDDRLALHLGVNYDTCHLAVEFEEPDEAIQRLVQNDIRISKLHFSSALKLCPSTEVLAALAAFRDPVYLHQVVSRSADGGLARYKDLGLAIKDWTAAKREAQDLLPEWRVHYHIPLHSEPGEGFETTADHLIGVMDRLAADPALCSHIEMETYTWEVLPDALKRRDVVDQLVDEYRWTLARLRERGAVVVQ